MRAGNQYTGSAYTEWLEYIRERLPVDGYKAVAAHIGTSVEAVRTQMRKWRKQGIEVPNMTRVAPEHKAGKRGPAGCPDGTIRTKIIGGIEYQYRKQGEKWVMVTGSGVRKVPKKAKLPKPLKVPVVTKAVSKKKVIRVEKKYTNREHGRTVTVKVDSKTYIQVPEGHDVGIAVEKWKLALENKVKKIKAGGRVKTKDT